MHAVDRFRRTPCAQPSSANATRSRTLCEVALHTGWLNEMDKCFPEQASVSFARDGGEPDGSGDAKLVSFRRGDNNSSAASLMGTTCKGYLPLCPYGSLVVAREASGLWLREGGAHAASPGNGLVAGKGGSEHHGVKMVATWALSTNCQKRGYKEAVMWSPN